MSTPSVSVEVITPDKANEYLSRNPKNRPLDKSAFHSLATEVRATGWRFTGDAISFDLDGNLMNGQHRLTLVSKGDESVEFLVARGVPRESMESMDRGKRRSLADTLHLRGESYTKNLASVIRSLYRYDHLGNLGSTGVTQATEAILLNYFYTARPDLAPKLRHLVTSLFNLKVLGINQTDLVVIRYCITEAHGEEEAEAFFSQVKDGFNLSPESPIAKLRTRLIDSLDASRGQNNRKNMSRRALILDRVDIAALTIKAFNHWIRGEEPDRLIWRRGGKTREPFPRVDGYPHFQSDKDDTADITTPISSKEV